MTQWKHQTFHISHAENLRDLNDTMKASDISYLSRYRTITIVRAIKCMTRDYNDTMKASDISYLSRWKSTRPQWHNESIRHFISLTLQNDYYRQSYKMHDTRLQWHNDWRSTLCIMTVDPYLSIQMRNDDFKLKITLLSPWFTWKI